MTGIRLPRPPWRTPGTRWQRTDGSHPERVFVVERFLPAKQRVRCRVESTDGARGQQITFTTSDFEGRARRLFQVGEQLELHGGAS